MKKFFNSIILLSALLCFSSCSQENIESENINMSLKSVITYADFNLDINNMRIRDPFIVVDPVTQLYYMYYNNGGKTSAYSSPDMTNWREAGDVFIPEPGYWANSDFWAPDVYFYNDKYYLFLTLSNNGIDRGTSILVGDTPMGPFSTIHNGPATPTEKLCLDGSLFVDENNKPWILYSHEWLQVGDGKILAQRLADDLSRVIGEPVELFKATDAPWVGALYAYGVTGYVTDAPFVHRTEDNELIMIWASFDKNGKYAIGQAYSQSGTIVGPWVHQPVPLNNDDGGHSMIFRDLHGKLKISYHAPNSLTEKPVIRDIFIQNRKISFVDDIYILEEFDGEIINNTCGDFLFKNYDEGTSSWIYSIDETSKLSGTNSLQLNIANSGSDFWTLQMRAANMKMKQDKRYSVKFKAKADKNTSFEFRSEGALNHIQNITLDAGQIKDVSFELPSATFTGNSTLLFGFGNSGNDYTLWLDAIEIIPIEPSYVYETLLNEEFNNLNSNIAGNLFLNNYSSSDSFWSYSIDNSNLLNGNNALRINVGNTGSDFWTLQVRTGDIPIWADKKYFVSFVAKSDKDVTVEFRSEGPLNHIEKINLQAGKVSYFNFELNSPVFDALGVMFFALGNTGSNYNLWLDNLKIESKK